jgi:hypothetical protein
MTLDKHIALLTLLFILSFSRTALDTGDFINYRQSIEFDEWSLYFYKEFVFWGVASAIKEWTGSFDITVYVIDALLAMILVLAIPNRYSRMRLSTIALPAVIFLSFPVLMGFTNVYRQLAGLSIFLVALNVHFHSSRPRWNIHLLFLLACFTHNVFVAFYLLYLMQLRIASWKVLCTTTFLGVLTVALLDTYIFQGLSDVYGLHGVESGGDTRFILLAMNLFLVLAYRAIKIPKHLSAAEQLKFFNVHRYQRQIWGLLASIYACIPLFTESTTERLVTLCFVISLYLTVTKYCLSGQARFSPVLFNVFLFGVAVLPSFLSTSAISLIFP